MHQGVLRDIAKEEREKEQQALLMASVQMQQPNVVAASAAAAQASSPPSTAPQGAEADCVGGICDLSQTRFRDPSTGKVYVPADPEKKQGGSAALLAKAQ